MKTVLAMTALALAATATLAVAGPHEGHHRGAMLERLKAADTNGDGLISRAEAAALPRINQNFDAIDANRDGQVSFDELRAFHQAKRAEHAKAGGAGFMKRLDTNADGKVSKAEALAAAEARFNAVDADKDGFITPEEMKAARAARHAKHAQK